MVVEANQVESNDKIEIEESLIPKGQRLNCIYDENPLGFEKDPLVSSKKIQAQDTLEEIDL